MRILTLALIGASAAMALATPALAQNRDRDDRYYEQRWRMTPARNSEIRQDINRLRQDINRADNRNRISDREADRLRARARDVQQLYSRYARNGLSWREVNVLERRVNEIRVALRYERCDWDGRPG